jgi:FixJ family two-component response regulator
LNTTPLVFVVHEDPAVRASIADLICHAGLQPECFESALDFLARPRRAVPACLLLDTRLPDLSGIELQARLATEKSELPVIFVTACQDLALTVQAMKAGALEYLTLPFHPDAVLSAVVTALEQSRTALLRHAELRALRERFSLLTRREREVMERIVSGRLNKQVGGDLGISIITVKAHRGRVMRKMRAESLAQLVGMFSTLSGGHNRVWHGLIV